MRKGTILAPGLLTLSLLLPAHPASAQIAEPRALTIEASNITARADGRADNPDAASVPGDVIEYRLTFTNHQDGPVTDVVLNDPIPAGLVFVPGSVTGSRADLVIERRQLVGAARGRRRRRGPHGAPTGARRSLHPRALDSHGRPEPGRSGHRPLPGPRGRRSCTGR